MADGADTFNRSDTISDLGAEWADAEGVGLGIIDQAAYSSAAAAQLGSLWVATAQANNQFAQATISGVGAGNYFSIMVVCEGADGTLDGYRGAVGGSDELYLSRIDNGVGTDLGAAGTFTLADGMVMRVEREGTTLRLKLDGVTRHTRTDGTYSSGKTGLAIYTESGANTVRFENFSAGDIGSAGSAVATVDHAQATFQGQAVPLRYTAPLINAQAVFQGQNVSLLSGGGTIALASFAQAAFEPQPIFFLFGAPRDAAELVGEEQEINFILRFVYAAAQAVFAGQNVTLNSLAAQKVVVETAHAVFAPSVIGLTATGTVVVDDMVEDNRTIVRPMAFSITDTDR